MALMRLLADENMPLLAIELLRRRGGDVLAIAESTPSICDDDFMFLAEDEGHILLTFDKDFGELAYSSKPSPSCGIILFRIPLRSADYIAKMIAEVLDCRNDWPGHFTVVEPGRIRLREL
jgi:predicted nuclease of predicted toxin-antitoxin system